MSSAEDGNKAWMSTLTALNKYYTGSSTQWNETKQKAIKALSIGKEKIKLSFFTYDTSIYIGNIK